LLTESGNVLKEQISNTVFLRMFILAALAVTWLRPGDVCGQELPAVNDTLRTPDPDNPAIVHLEIRNAKDAMVANGFMFNGRKTGVWRTWAPYGSLMFLEEYHGDVLHGIRYGYNIGGCIELEEIYRNGVLHGPRNKFHYGIQKSLEEHYVNGRLEGLRTVYYDTGSRQEAGVYRDGKKDGVVKWFNQAGLLTIEYTYSMGVLNGPAKTFSGKGKLQTEGMFKDNNEEGEWKEYDEGGRLVKTRTYDSGNLIQEQQAK